LVGFRTAAFFSFSQFEAMTYQLAAGEWAVFLLGLTVLWLTPHRKAADE
jgi:hypothetical protein